MDWKPGDRVQHRSLPSLGAGEILSVEGTKLSIRFADGEPRVFLTTAPLDRLAGPAASPSRPRASIDPPKKLTHTGRATADARARLLASGGRAEVRSAKSQRADVWGACSVCGVPTRPLWCFADTSAGPLYFCVPCKDQLYDAARGPRDVLDLSSKVVWSSAFESKK